MLDQVGDALLVFSLIEKREDLEWASNRPAETRSAGWRARGRSSASLAEGRVRGNLASGFRSVSTMATGALNEGRAVRSVGSGFATKAAVAAA